MLKMSPLLMMDGYKTDHRRQYPKGTEVVTSNFTPRASRNPAVKSVVVFGLQYFLQEYLVERFYEDFFRQSLGDVIDEYRNEMDQYVGKDAIPTEHIEQLHSLGYLPLEIRALAEGTLCPIRVPMLTITNTHKDFFWLTNQLETILSASFWLGCTSATMAYQYRTRFDSFNARCGTSPEFAKFQGHDFSFRGMSSLESAMISGAAHLTSFVGTDTIPAIQFVKKYYSGKNNGLIGCSVPATEHSVMCMGGKDNEIDTYRRLITKLYPSGIVSIVSDTWDFWSIMTTGIRELHDDITARDGKVVFRPDSGDPVKIICGDPSASPNTPEWFGAYRLLWNEFGGSNVGGHNILNEKVGLIYGDAITLDRQLEILSKLKEMGFAPNIVLGIGSYSYQYATRDTYGFAMKATYGEVNGESREIFKEPKTDSGEKKSAKGRVAVYENGMGDLQLYDQCTQQQADGGLLKPKFRNGQMISRVSLADIRSRLHPKQF